MKMYRGVKVQLHIILTSALGGGEWPASRLRCRLTLIAYWIGGLVGPREKSLAVVDLCFIFQWSQVQTLV
jgi:hypothetical protein